jgi:ATP/ADP translocase
MPVLFGWAQGSLLLSLRWLVGTVVAMSGVMLLAKLYMDNYIAVGVNPRLDAGADAAKRRKKPKSKGSFAESFEVLRSSPKIANLVRACWPCGRAPKPG